MVRISAMDVETSFQILFVNINIVLVFSPLSVFYNEKIG
jgi:hypothetical protein